MADTHKGTEEFYSFRAGLKTKKQNRIEKPTDDVITWIVQPHCTQVVAVCPVKCFNKHESWIITAASPESQSVSERRCHFPLLLSAVSTDLLFPFPPAAHKPLSWL